MMKVLNIQNNGININNILMLDSSSSNNGTVLKKIRFTVADRAYQHMTLRAESPVGLQPSMGNTSCSSVTCIMSYMQNVNTE